MTAYKKHAVLLIGFSRPIHMSKVLSKIENYYPDELYIFVDGVSDMASQETLENNSKVIELANNFSGAKNINIKISHQNLGCGVGPVSAIDWALSKEDEIIILEDDCVPIPDFFNYMDKNLEELRNSECMMISSNKYDRFPQFGKSIKTRFTFTHGWATWKKSWSHYDYRLNMFNTNDLIDKNLTLKNNKNIWTKVAQEIKSGKNISYWDYQWQFSVWNNNGWSLQPPRNLSSNIGFDELSTHTSGRDWRESIKAIDKSAPIKSGFVEIGVLHNFVISIYKGSLPGYIYRLFRFKI